MSKNYIEVRLSGKNEFRLNHSSLSLFEISFSGVSMKIDTGCGYSTIPLQRLNVTASLAKEMKSKAVDLLISKLKHNIKLGCTLDEAVRKEYSKLYKLSYGVESGGRKHRQINFLDKNDLMREEAISFKHEVKHIILKDLSCEIKIPDTFMYVNYDRKGNILLGMDILKRWDIHMGTVKTGDTIFLACPYDQINDGYLQELQEVFKIASIIDASYARQALK